MELQFFYSQRAAVLSIRAAARGAIDFAEADARNPSWWRKFRLIADELEAETYLEISRRLFDFYLALLSTGQLDNNGTREVVESIQKQMQAMETLLQPWRSEAIQQRQQDRYDELLALYKEYCGDPEDPEYMQNLYEKSMRALRRPSPTPNAEASEEDRINQSIWQRRFAAASSS